MKKIEWIVTCKHDKDFEASFTRLVDALAFMDYNGTENYNLIKLVYDI